MTDDGSPVARRRARALPAAGLAGLLSGTALMALLHVLPSTREIELVDDTISEHMLTPNRWLFSVSVLLIAFGSVAVFATLVRRRLVRPVSGTTAFSALWVAGLLAIITFAKTDWSVGPSVAGTIHRYASVIAFVALPMAVFLAAPAVYARPRWLRLLTRLLAVTSLLWFGVILGAVVVMLSGGPPWWQSIPLGLVERLLALNEILALVVLAIGVLGRSAGMVDVTARPGKLRVPS